MPNRMPVKRSWEALAFLLLLILGLAPRLALVSKFPTIPFSDFANLVAFALAFHDQGLTGNIQFWEYLNPGLPLVLYGLFHVFPRVDAATVARLSTVFACGLMPILPFLIWRGILPFWVRVLAGSALALWPGQILFSGVVAQDNWVLLPSVALGALAVRRLIGSAPARPIIAGLLLGVTAAIRQEMMVALLPVFLVAAGVHFRAGWRRVVVASLAAGLPLVALAAYRQAATGRFALTSEHAGLAILSSYVPGAAATAYNSAYPYVASVRPDLLRDRKAFFAQASSLAFQEAFRRPGFHAAVILSWVCTFAVAGEFRSLYWSLGAPEVLPAALHERGAALETLARRPLLFELAAIQGLFLAAVIIGLWRRNPAILVLASVVLLKYVLHALTAIQGRYFFVATALEILVIVLAAYEIQTMPLPDRRWLAARALAAGTAFGIGLLLFAPWLEAFVLSRDIDQQRTYHFILEPQDRSAALACAVNQGLLASLEMAPRDAVLHASVERRILRVALRTFQQDPPAGDVAAAVCELTGSGETRPVLLQILDPYAPGGLPGRMLQRVEVDGHEVYSHDIAREPGIGWANIPLRNLGMGTKRKVIIEVKAINPEHGWAWGNAARTVFQLTSSSPALNLAMYKAASQSSTLSGYATTGAGAAVDGNTDGNFSAGSVTHTDVETNAWWEVDLGASVPIGSIVIWNRTDCCSERLDDYWVFVSDIPFRPTDTPATLKSRAGTWSSHQTAVPHPSVRITVPGASGRYVRVQLGSRNSLSLAEVQVFGQ